MNLLFNLKRNLFITVSTLSILSASAAEKKAIKDLNTDEITTECQITPESGADHVALVWWIPSEFWVASLLQDPSVTPQEVKGFKEALAGVSIVAIVQADISDFGIFKFYSEEKITKSMTLKHTDSTGKTQVLTPIKDIKPELRMVLGVIKPMLSNAMGNMGQNFHFYVLNDVDEQQKRILDPYSKGKFEVTLETSKKAKVTSKIQFPLNSFHVARTCPNGKKAHISWQFCPWTGKKLAE